MQNSNLIQPGTEFRLKPEFMDEGDAEFTFRALEAVDGDRFLCVIECGLPMNPTQVVKVDWVECVVVDGVETKIGESIEITEADFVKFLAVLKGWEIVPDLFENLHDVCDANQALIDAFGWDDEDFDNEEAMGKTVDFGNVFAYRWNKAFKEGSLPQID